MRMIQHAIAVVLVFSLVACQVANPSPVKQPLTTETVITEPALTEPASSGMEPTSPAPVSPSATVPAPGATANLPSPGAPRDDLLYPEDLVYLGAFRLPEGSNGSDWEYSGGALTYYPEGDPGGGQDGFPGSLFAIGHDHQQYVSEISIPAPVGPAGGDLSGLPTAETLQPFHDITAGMFGYLEIPRAGLAYLPAQTPGGEPGLYFSWTQHFQFEPAPAFGWSRLALDDPQPQGPWYLGDYTNYITGDYLFALPADWAAAHTPGSTLVAGRFRDGEWGGLGPTLLAFSPIENQAHPAPQGRLSQVTPLLLYGEPVPGAPEVDVSARHRMQGYAPADEWSGAAWLVAGERSAVVLAGTKALGAIWYGFANGVVYPTSGDPNEPVPEVPPWPYDQRGWWSENISAQLIFFDPQELAQVASGAWETWQPQPYAVLTLDGDLVSPGFDFERQKRYLLGGIAYDDQQQRLYLIERRADGEKSLVHVYLVGE